MSSWTNQVLHNTQGALRTKGDATKADGAAKYMKQVAPFLGIAAPDRRRLLRIAWTNLPSPTSDELGMAARALMTLPDREYHYAASDLIDKYLFAADEYFLAEHLGVLLVTTPWWDTVDGFVNAGVSPLCRRYDATTIINEWSESENRWLIRAAIGHQRGWKKDTNVKQILQLCDRHWDNSEFFIAKAIGWALRDITVFDPNSVKHFLSNHPVRNTIAEREANRGLKRSQHSPSQK